MLLAIDIISFILCTIGPSFLALTVLLVLFPIALILCAVCVHVLAVAVCLIILPLALVDISISMNESAKSICLVVLPETLIERAISPDLLTLPIALVNLLIPLTLVLCSILQEQLFLLHSVLPVVLYDRISEVTKLSFDLLHSLIVIVTLTICVALEGVPLCHGLRLEPVPLLDTAARVDPTEESLDLNYGLSVCAQELR
jgi:hypothetical protein